MELANELAASLREFFAAGLVEIREQGGRVIPASDISWEIRGAAEKPLLHLWAEQYNLTRRVLAITEHSERRLALAVERFGRNKPDRLEFLRLEFDRSPREHAREEFCARFKRILTGQFPDETLESSPFRRTSNIPYPEITREASLEAKREARQSLRFPKENSGNPSKTV